MSVEDPRHGTPDGYRTDGCRCEKCLRAWAEYVTDGRKRRKNGPIPDTVRHGTLYCRNEYGCHCDECTDAARNQKRIRVILKEEIRLGRLANPDGLPTGSAALVLRSRPE